MIRLPRLTTDYISECVEGLRRNSEILSTMPVDIEAFAELELGMEMIPVPQLRGRVGADAFITHDFSSILIDLEYFNSPKMQSRNRFSIAHELGHFFLHKEYFIESCPSDTDEEWIQFMLQMDDMTHHSLEWQANAFASILLMPKQEFISSFDTHVSFAELSRKFGVSETAVRKRIDADDVRETLSKRYLN